MAVLSKSVDLKLNTVLTRRFDIIVCDIDEDVTTALVDTPKSDKVLSAPVVYVVVLIAIERRPVMGDVIVLLLELRMRTNDNTPRVGVRHGWRASQLWPKGGKGKRKVEKETMSKGQSGKPKSWGGATTLGATRR